MRFSSSGARGGFYHDVANQVIGLLGEDQRTGRNKVSGGSVQNLLQLATPKSEVNVVLALATLVFYLYALRRLRRPESFIG